MKSKTCEGQRILYPNALRAHEQQPNLPETLFVPFNHESYIDHLSSPTSLLQLICAIASYSNVPAFSIEQGYYEIPLRINSQMKTTFYPHFSVSQNAVCA